MTEPCPHCGAAVPHGRGHCPSCLRAVPVTVDAASTSAVAERPVLPWAIAAFLAVVVVFLLALLVARDRRQAVATDSSPTTTDLVVPPPTISPQVPPPTTSPPPSTTPPPATSPPPTTSPDTAPPPTSSPPSTTTTTVPDEEAASRFDPERSSRQTLNAAPVGTPTRLWRSMFPSPDFETTVAFHDQPTENVMVVNAVSGLFVLDPEDGAILWQTSSFDTDFRVVDVGENDVVVASAVETWVVDREQGEEVWRAPLVAGSSVRATEDAVVVLDGDRVDIHERTTGELRLELEAIDDLAVAVDGTELVVRAGGVLRLLDRVAVEQWAQPIEQTAELWLVEESVVAVSQRPTATALVSFARTDGTERWSREIGADQSVNIASDDVIVLSDATRRIGLDAASGEELWQADPSSTDEPTTDDHDGLSVEARGADEVIVRRVADGGIAWPQAVPGRVAIAVGQRIAMVLAGPEVVGFDLVSGAELWRVQPEIPDPTVISAIENGFVVANTAGEVEGWRLAGGGDAESKV